MGAVLLDAVTENTTGTAQRRTGPTDVIASGTFNSGNVSLQTAPLDGGDFVEVHNFTAAGVITLDITGGYRLRAVYTGSGGNVSVQLTN